MSHSVDLYWHPLSPPARIAAVALNAGSGKVTVNYKLVDLLKGEQRAESFKEVSAKGQVPALVDGDLKLIESHAIARYAADKYQDEANPIYPKDLVARAKVDEALEVVRSDVATDTATLIYQTVFAAKMGRPTSEEAITKAKEGLVKGLTFIDGHFFKTSPSALVGSTVTLADLVFAVFLHQLGIVKYDFSPYPKVQAYFEVIKTNPIVAKTHEPFLQALAAFS
eukprot:TRINITY_DN4026_c0_g2_i1.p1 TRINITY_DN4026_c0_g2~~TRINITY_DN4026_c0_g2_i1.p1  ORF type:complete len:224 (+),score=63.09 TRINITY_DN4026_c0_g2_i1:46-717(+)